MGHYNVDLYRDATQKLSEQVRSDTGPQDSDPPEPKDDKSKAGLPTS